MNHVLFKNLLLAFNFLLIGCIAKTGVDSPLDASATGLVNQGSLSASLGSDLSATLQSNGVSSAQTSTIVNTAMYLSNNLAQEVQSQLYQASLLAKQQDSQAQPISAAQAEQLSVAEISAEFVKGALQGVKKAGTLEINGLSASAAKAKVTGLSAGSPLKTLVKNNLVSSATDKETAFKAISNSAVSNLGEAGFTSVSEISAVIVNISEQSVTAVASAGSAGSEAGDAAKHLVSGVISGLKNINKDQVTDFDASKLAQLTSSATSGSVKGLSAFSGLDADQSKTAIKAVTSASLDAIQLAVKDFKAKVDSGQQNGIVDSSLLTNMIKEAANGISANVSALEVAQAETVTSLLSEVSTAVNENMDELSTDPELSALGAIDKNVLADDVIKGMTVAIADYGISSAELITEVSDDFTGDVSISVDVTVLENSLTESNNSFGRFGLLGQGWPGDLQQCIDSTSSRSTSSIAVFDGKKSHIIIIDNIDAPTVHFPGSESYAKHSLQAAMLYVSDPASCLASNLAIVRYYSTKLDSYGFAVIKTEEALDSLTNDSSIKLTAFEAVKLTSKETLSSSDYRTKDQSLAETGLPVLGFAEYTSPKIEPLIDKYGRLHPPQINYTGPKVGVYELGKCLPQNVDKITKENLSQCEETGNFFSEMISSIEALTSESTGTVSIDDSKITESTGTVSIDDSKITESTGTVSIDDSKITESTGTVSIDDSKISEFTGTISIDDSKISESTGTVSTDDSKITESTGTISIDDIAINDSAGTISTVEDSPGGLDSSTNQPPVILYKPSQMTDRIGDLTSLRLSGSFWFDPNKDTPFTGKGGLFYFLYSPSEELTSCTPNPYSKEPSPWLPITENIYLQTGADSDIFFTIDLKADAFYYGTGYYMLCLSGPITDVSGQVYVDEGTIISGEPFFVQIQIPKEY